MKNAKKKAVAGLLGVAVLLGAISCRAQDLRNLTLTQAVSLALQNSRDMALARARYTTAKNRARVARAEFLPNLYTGSGAAYTNGFPQALSGQPPSLLQLTYSQAILEGPLRGQLQAEEERVKNEEVELSRARDAVVVRAATSYLELAKVRHSLELLRNERGSAERIIQLTRERAATGLELPIEVTRGELTLAKIEQRIVQLGGRSQILTTQLQNLTGLPPERLEGISAQELPEVERPAKDLVHIALENSPVLKEAENERAARQHLLNGERGGYWPSVALVGQYNVLSRFNNYDQFYKSFQRNNVSVGFLIRIPIFSSKTSANVAFARSKLSEAEVSLGILRENAEVAAEQRVSTSAEQDAALAVAKLELKLAQENLALMQSRFDQGQTLLKDLEEARLDEGERWMAFLDADFARQRAQLALMEMTGRLSQVFK